MQRNEARKDAEYIATLERARTEELLQEHYRKGVEYQEEYDPRPKPKPPEPYKIPGAVSVADSGVRKLRQDHQKRAHGKFDVRMACFTIGSSLFILSMVLLPAHNAQTNNYLESLDKYSVDFSKWDLTNPSTWKIPDVPEIEEPGWFVKHGAELVYYTLWLGILFLLWGLYMNMEK